MHLTPNSFGSLLREFNSCHEPKGSSRGGGRFAKKGTCGGETTVAGITSYGRPDQPGATSTARQTFETMRGVEQQLRAIPSVRHAAVYPTQGAYQGGWEPSWTVQYTGNGEARRLLAKVGQQHSQSAVLYTRTCRSDCNSVATEFAFDGAIRRPVREALGGLFAEVGLGGWSWYKAGGKTRLRIVAVPHWGGTPKAHRAAMRQVRRHLRSLGLGHQRSDRPMVVETFGPDGEQGYDAILSGQG